MGVAPELRHALHVSLKGRDNETYRGTLVLKNWTLLYPGGFAADIGSTTPSPTIDDPTGASYYVIAVVLVYGMSIVMLIASHIKRKHQKLVEDKQIHKYLQEFMIVKEKSSRENYRNLKKTIVQKLNWERNPTYRNLSRAIIPAIAVPVGRQLKMITEESFSQGVIEPDTRGPVPASAPGTLQAPGRRSRRGSSPAVSIMDFGDTHPGSNDRKQRRKGMGNLFMQAPSLDFTHSVFEKLTELNDIRQEARARVNSIAFSSTSACSIDATGARISEADSVAESDMNMDCQSDTDSHITLPAITICRPQEEPQPRAARLTPLPTIEDVEPFGDSSADNLSSDSSDEDGYTPCTTTAVSSEDDLLDADTDREDVWLMDRGDRSPEPRGTCNGGSSPSPRLEGGRLNGRAPQRHVHFSSSTKRRNSPGRPARLTRQHPVQSENSDIEDSPRPGEDENTLQITCV